MAVEFTPSGNVALSGSTEPTGPVLTVIPGGWRGDESDVEAIAFMDETARVMDELATFEATRQVSSLDVIQKLNRVGYRAGLAKAEVLRLRSGGDAA